MNYSPVQSNPDLNQKGRLGIPAQQQGFSNDLKNTQIPVNQTRPKDSVLMQAAEVVPIFRRTASVDDNVKKKNYTAVAGALALTAINFPEDCRDIKNAYQQVECSIKGKKFEGAYNYKELQHEFSFFKGTLLEPLIDIKNSKNPKLAEKLYNYDKSLLKTPFGRKILSLLNIKDGKFELVKTFNKEKGLWEASKDINGKIRIANGFCGNWFGKLTARAMARTTLIGTTVIAALEVPKICNSIFKGKTAKEKVENTAKQILKSSINIASTTAGIAYGGAIGSKYGKGLGSLIGMGIGAVIGSKISNKIQDSID